MNDELYEGKLECKFLCFCRGMEVSVEIRKACGYVCTSVLYFTTYSQNFLGIFHNVRWDFPDPDGRSRRSASEAVGTCSPPTIQPPTWSPDFHVCGKLKRYSEAGDFHLTTLSNPRSRNSLRIGTPPSTARAWKIPLCFMKSAWTSFEIIWKKGELMSGLIHVHFMSLLNLHPPEKKGNLFSELTS
jgi:hypothetical protein